MPCQVYDTVRLSARQYQRAIAHLKQRASPPARVKERPHRFTFGEGVELFCRVVGVGTRDTYFRVRTRDISSTGMGFLHGTYLAPGRDCELTLINRKTRDGLRLMGRTVRCRHITGNIHEVGVKLDSALNLASPIVGMAATVPGVKPSAA